MKNFLLLFAAIITSNCTVNKNSKKEVDIRPVLRIVDSLGMENVLIEGKWLMYCMYCHDTVKFQPEYPQKTDVTFGELELNFDTVVTDYEMTFWRDTTLHFFYTFYKDTIPCFYETIKNGISIGVVFDNKKQEPLAFVCGGGMSVKAYQIIVKDYQNLFEPYKGVAEYMMIVGNKADPWFRQEAIRRGVIKE